MLTFNPAERISAREALNDRWLQINASSAPISPKALKNLSAFSVSDMKFSCRLKFFCVVKEQAKASNFDIYCYTNDFTSRKRGSSEDFPESW